jgi:energy-converting hydrogenase B subunit L
MNPILQLIKHAVFGVRNIPRILLGTSSLTDGQMRRRILAGQVKYPDTVDVDLCLGCGLCSKICPTKCITMKPLPEKIKLREGQYKDKYPELNPGQCIFCFQCHDNCPTFTVHQEAAAIHPRGVRKTGLKAEDLFKRMDSKAKAGREGGPDA